MIKKRIHYCWFGDNEKPQLVQECMSTWNLLSEYEVTEWNEENIIDFMDSRYLREAISNKKWAFASDYVRLRVLYEYGGVYLDTDVEITKSFDDLLETKMFIGFIYDCSIGTAIIGSKEKNSVILELLNLYDEIAWDEDYKYFTVKSYPGIKLMNNNDLFTMYFLNRFSKFKLNNKIQSFEGIIIYPKDYFEIKPIFGKNYSVHHCIGSWVKNPEGGSIALKDMIKSSINSLFSILPFINGDAILVHILYKKNIKRKPFYKIHLEHKK